jgi:hypothetical protein
LFLGSWRGLINPQEVLRKRLEHRFRPDLSRHSLAVEARSIEVH